VYSYPSVLFYPNCRIIQEKGKEKAPHHCVEHEKKRRKKNHHKFGGRSLSVYILRYLFCIYIGLFLVRGGDESIAKKNVNGMVEKEERREKWRRHRSSSTDGQVAPARNTIRYTCVYVCIHIKKEKKEEKKRGLCECIHTHL
jgi:hypothetical protein